MRAPDKGRYTSDFALEEVLAFLVDVAGWETVLVTVARLSEMISQ